MPGMHIFASAALPRQALPWMLAALVYASAGVWARANETGSQEAAGCAAGAEQGQGQGRGGGGGGGAPSISSIPPQILQLLGARDVDPVVALARREEARAPPQVQPPAPQPAPSAAQRGCAMPPNCPCAGSACLNLHKAPNKPSIRGEIPRLAGKHLAESAQPRPHPLSPANRGGSRSRWTVCVRTWPRAGGGGVVT